MVRSARSRAGNKPLFITGTDTGVGKTLFTALLLRHLRGLGCHALAMKPFCSGGRADVKLLQSLQPGELTDDETNPYYFADPVAPLIARDARRRRIRLGEVLAHVQSAQAKCERLLIEGSGGLLVPLGPRFTVADLIGALDCEVVVVARNKLGTINHTLLTVSGLKSIRRLPLAIILMSQARPDLASCTNHQVLSGLLRPITVISIPFLGNRPLADPKSKKNASNIRKALAVFVESDDH